jgi:hypothetical protein
MIVKKELTKYEDKHRIVMFDSDKKGGYVQKTVVPEIAAKEKLATDYYITRKVELEDLIEELKNGRISPIKLYMDYICIDSYDLAKRVGMSRSKLKKAFTLEGFKDLKIKDLMKFTVVFDNSLADFFQLLHVSEQIPTDIKYYQGRLIQEVLLRTVKSKKK